MSALKIIVKTRIYPTEDPNKVLYALHNLFPAMSFSLANGEYLGESQDTFVLFYLFDLMKERKIRTTVETILRQNFNGRQTHLGFNKQDAVHEVVNVSESGYLGDIRLIIEGDIEQVIDLLWATSE